MYSEQEIKEFKTRTENLLKKVSYPIEGQEESASEVQELADVINFHDHLYYVKTEPVITDYEYDLLFKRLKAIESKFPGLIQPDSPTNRVAAGLTKEFPTVEHLAPMLSLDNSYNEDDLIDFDRRVRELSGMNEVEYTVEPKFDGGSISLVFEDDRLIRAVTRGDGIMGEEVTPNLRVIKSVPLKAAFSKYGIRTVEIRGEVVIDKKKFEEINASRMEQGLAALANPRNTAAGSIRLQDAEEVAKRGLDIILYHISYARDKDGKDMLGKELKSRSENISMLSALGFKTPGHEIRVVNSVSGIHQYIEEWAEKRDRFRYEIDGMVIKVNDLRLEDRIGTTSHHPRWAIAYKFRARQARTKLLRVDFHVGRIGTITPVAKLAPVALGGVTITSASMFNEEFIEEKDIRVGDDVLVERAGDVIPYIAAPIKESRDGSEQKIDFPRDCPSCGEKLVREEEEAAWRCINLNCPAQQYFRFLHFASRDAMDISGLGKALVERFIEEGWLKSIPDIYKLPYPEIMKLEGFGERSVEKLRESIEKSKSQPSNRLLYGLGVRHVGETTAKDIASRVGCIEELASWKLEDLESISGIGPKVANSIFDFFHDPQNIAMIEELKGLEVNTCRQEKSTDAGGEKLSGLTFLFTGALAEMSRTEAKEMVENEGGKVASALSSNVNYLVVGDDPGSKVEKAKKLKTVQVIDEKTFLQMIEKQ